MARVRVPPKLGSPAFSLPPSCLPHRRPPFLRVAPCCADLRVPRGFREPLVKRRPKKGFPQILAPRHQGALHVGLRRRGDCPARHPGLGRCVPAEAHHAGRPRSQGSRGAWTDDERGARYLDRSDAGLGARGSHPSMGPATIVRRYSAREGVARLWASKMPTDPEIARAACVLEISPSRPPHRHPLLRPSRPRRPHRFLRLLPRLLPRLLFLPLPSRARSPSAEASARHASVAWAS